MSGWDCEAYGPGGLDTGAVCFFGGDQQVRVCANPAECTSRMQPERVRLFDLITRGAAAGDPTYVVLADGLTSPEQLLGGPKADRWVTDEDQD